MKTANKIINALALLIVAWQAMSLLSPSATSASANSPYGEAICFYPESARKTSPGLYVFMTIDPTEKLYLAVSPLKETGMIARDDGGYSNAALNKLFPNLVN